MEKRAGHQGLGIAAGHIEKHQIGGRIIQKGGKQAGHPEIHAVDGRAVGRVHQRNQLAEMAGLARFQNGNHRRNGDENAQKELAHFENRIPVEFITRAHLRGGDFQRNQRQRQQNAVAHQVLQRIMAAENFK